MIQRMLTVWSLVPLPFLNPAWTSGSSQFMYCWSLTCRILSIALLACKMSARRRQWHPTPIFLPGESHGRRSLVGCSPWGHKSQTRLSDFTFTFHFHALEKEMATHSSVLVWRIPGMAEPGGLPSMGLQSRTRLKWLSSSSSSKMSAIVQWFEHSLALPFFGIGMKTDLFQSCGHCWVFQICWLLSAALS